MDFTYLAQKLVEATSQLVGGRTINFMNPQGIIIASTEKERIGSFHEGAAKAVWSGTPVSITKEEVNHYKGAKEGFNMPIFYENKIFGVVGIYGNPEEIESLANLLRVYVTQFISQQYWMRSELLKKEMNLQLICLLLSANKTDYEEIRRLCKNMEIELKFPMKIYLFKTTLKRAYSYQNLEQLLLWKKYIAKEHDLYGCYEDEFLWFHFQEAHHNKENEELEAYLTQQQEHLIISSRIITEIKEIPTCFKEISIYLSFWQQQKNENKTYINLAQMQNQRELYLYYISQNMGNEYLNCLYNNLIQDAGVHMADVLLHTALIYYQEEKSIKKASEKLHIHKNTLLYRLKRLDQILKTEEDSSFTKYLFIDLILKNQSLKKNK